jgi:putative transposase
MPPKEIPDELIDQLLAGREGPEAITGPDGLLKQLTKRVVERAASAELTEHLGYEGRGHLLPALLGRSRLLLLRARRA